ncbi:MAG: hypothetical protein QOE17_477 [Gaiellales bacterium]|jgi:hypothetical protein|nr:hypothetical protein [Gaiellales bacterium]
MDEPFSAPAAAILPTEAVGSVRGQLTISSGS